MLFTEEKLPSFNSVDFVICDVPIMNTGLFSTAREIKCYLPINLSCQIRARRIKNCLGIFTRNMRNPSTT